MSRTWLALDSRSHRWDNEFRSRHAFVSDFDRCSLQRVRNNNRPRTIVHGESHVIARMGLAIACNDLRQYTQQGITSGGNIRSFPERMFHCYTRRWSEIKWCTDESRRRTNGAGGCSRNWIRTNRCVNRSHAQRNDR